MKIDQKKRFFIQNKILIFDFIWLLMIPKDVFGKSWGSIFIYFSCQLIIPIHLFL